MKHELEILARVLEGEASREEVEELVQALRDDEGLRREAARLTAVHGQLGVALEGEIGRERRVGAVMAAVGKVDSDEFVRGVRGRLLWRRRVMQGLGLAAVLALGVIGWQQLGRSSSPAGVLAKIERAENLDWGTSEERAAGSIFLAGESLNFRSGLVELEMAGRGRMVIEGPAQLEFPAAGRAVLRRGRVVMRVTPAGQGFRLETPKGTIIDLGTEFGVAVDGDGMVETHVLEGQVETVDESGGRVTLDQDEALRFGERGAERIEADGGSFYTRMPPRAEGAASFIHWSLDEHGGLLAHAEAKGLGGARLEMAFHAMDEGSAPVWVDGVFGGALSFDGKGSYAESGYRGIGGGAPRTVAFWVKVPEDFSIRQGFGILSWGRSREDRLGEVWQVSVNPLEHDGPVGRLRVGLHGGQVIGSSDLRDGEWHHVAVVLYGGSRPNVGTHVLLYVDGKIETVSRRALRVVRTEVERADHGVWIGRNVTYRKSDAGHAHGGFFRGEVDEVFIFDAALGHQEVRRLMRKNDPNP